MPASPLVCQIESRPRLSLTSEAGLSECSDGCRSGTLRRSVGRPCVVVSPAAHEPDADLAEIKRLWRRVRPYFWRLRRRRACFLRAPRIGYPARPSNAMLSWVQLAKTRLTTFGQQETRISAKAGATGTAPLLASELPHYSEAETRVALHSVFAWYAGECRVGGVRRPRQERRIPVHRRS
jgi:hypothetical protein